MSDERKIRIYRYVAHGLRDRFEAQGWVFAGELPAPHCFYAVLYEWPGSEEELREAEDVGSDTKRRLAENPSTASE